MESRCGRSGGVGTFRSVLAALFAFALAGCASIQPAPAPAAASLPSDDDDWSQVVAQLRADLNRFNSREVARKPTIAPSTTTTQQRNREFADRARALFAPLSAMNLRMPVAGVRNRDLSDSWH